MRQKWTLKSDKSGFMASLLSCVASSKFFNLIESQFLQLYNEGNKQLSCGMIAKINEMANTKGLAQSTLINFISLLN